MSSPLVIPASLYGWGFHIDANRVTLQNMDEVVPRQSDIMIN